MKISNPSLTAGTLEERDEVLAITDESRATEKSESSGFTLAMIANFLWGTSFLASKYTLEAWGPFTASALRFALALVVIALVLPMVGYRIRLPRTKAALLGVLLVGVSGFGALYPLNQQAKLLRVIQERKVQRVGSLDERKVNFRSISATNVNLEISIDERRFRQDLYYRIAKETLRIPALRERLEDIPELVHYFLGRVPILVGNLLRDNSSMVFVFYSQAA